MWSTVGYQWGVETQKLGNRASAEVLGVGTWKLDLRGGRTMLLFNVLYTPDIIRKPSIFSYYPKIWLQVCVNE